MKTLAVIAGGIAIVVFGILAVRADNQDSRDFAALCAASGRNEADCAMQVKLYERTKSAESFAVIGSTNSAMRR